MSSWTLTACKTRNWSDYNQALKQRGSLSVWFDAEMSWEAKPSRARRRQKAYGDAAIQTCLTIKVLLGLPLRQTAGFVESLLELIGLDWSVPDFSTLCRRQKSLPVAITYRGSPGQLHLLIDSTGIKAEGEGALSAACFACACQVINGTRVSMAALNVAFGARSTLVSMSKHRRYMLSRSRVAAPARLG
jgi:hypothetical protein